MLWTDKQFWAQASWRSFRSFCQALAALLAGSSVNLLSADWKSMIGVAGTAGLVSLLMSVDRERAVAATVGLEPAPQPLQANYVGHAEPL